MNKYFFIAIIALLFSTSLIAQTEEDYVPMRVIHCTAVNQGVPVQNIHVDENNQKWVGNNKGLYKINSADNSNIYDLDNTDWSLLRQRGGNKNIILNSFDLSKLSAVQSFIEADGKDKITCTFYDSKKKMLWIGTSQSGVYRYRIGDDVKLTERLNVKDKQLVSNHINSILVDKYGREWVGTDAGVFISQDNKWRSFEKDTKIISIKALGPDVWILSDDILWRVDEFNRWTPGDVSKERAKGEIRDMAYDSDGKLWIASDIITRYDIVEDKVEVFDNSNGFTSKKINCITVDKDNALWVGTEDKGIYLIAKESSMTVTCLIDKELSCAGTSDDASLLVKVLGGTPPYEYSWDNEFSGPNPQNVGPGFYTVVVKDSEGQKRKVSADIEDNRMQVEIAFEGEESKANAKDGKATLKVTGGFTPYKFQWDNGETQAKAKRLNAGTHNVTVSDKAGCEYVTTVQIGGQVLASNNSPTDNSVLDISYDLTEGVKCGNDKTAAIQVTVDGGALPYTYVWSDNSLSGNSASSLGAGEYSVTVTDANNRSATQTFYIDAPPALMAVAVMDEAASGKRKRDGKAYVNAKGGNGSYKYEWDNGGNKSKNNKLTVGKHSVTVTDDNGCTAIAEVDVTLPINTALTSNNFKKGQTIRLDKLYFETDSKELTANAIPAVNEVVKFMERNTNVKIEVGGHTNSNCDTEYCNELSENRAKSVADYLVSKGITASRVSYKGYGKENPIASNRTKEGRAKNQRVEIKVLETGS